MSTSLTAGTWFWLLVPMLSCVALSIATWLIRPRAERSRP